MFGNALDLFQMPHQCRPWNPEAALLARARSGHASVYRNGVQSC